MIGSMIWMHLKRLGEFKKQAVGRHLEERERERERVRKNSKEREIQEIQLKDSKLVSKLYGVTIASFHDSQFNNRDSPTPKFLAYRD